MPLPESVRLELEAIDATLAGDAVDPRYADLAELTLLLADAKPELPITRAAALDRRFAAMSAAPARTRRVSPAVRRRWYRRPAFGAGLVLALSALIVVGVLSNRRPEYNNGPLTAGGVGHAAASSSGSSSSSSAVTRAASQPAAAAPTGLGVPTPQSNGRRIVQSAQLSLSAPGVRISAVAEELFDVVGTEQGIVRHSSVSTGIGGYASFTLAIPSQHLSATLARLAQLRYATVTSSTASTTDVNNQYLDDQRKLADVKALRSSLLTQLEAAVTTTAVDSLKTQIQDAESVIAKDEAALNGLTGRISYGAVSVQINTAATVPLRSDHSFTLRRAAHDAVDVLKVAAGVLLIVLAVLIPLGVVLALLAWIGSLWRRHRRERALDAT